jgi:phosphomannomutase
VPAGKGRCRSYPDDRAGWRSGRRQQLKAGLGALSGACRCRQLLRQRPGQDWKGNVALQDAIGAAEVELGEAGRVLIRASGTEPLLRVMVEARDAAQAQAIAERLAKAASAA